MIRSVFVSQWAAFHWWELTFVWIGREVPETYNAISHTEPRVADNRSGNVVQLF
jgi:hypothetical protein